MVAIPPPFDGYHRESLIFIKKELSTEHLLLSEVRRGMGAHVKITYQIRKEHTELLGSLDGLVELKKEDEEKRREGIRAIMISLDAHGKGEEQTLFPALRKLDATRSIALRAVEEHRILRIIMAEETATGVRDEIWLPRLVILRNLIKLHMQHEEDEVLMKADELFTETFLKELGKKFDFVKKTVKKTYLS